MKISDSFNKATGLGATTQARSGKTTEKAGTEKAGSDNVTLSTHAQVLARQASTDEVSFDAKKVEEIKAAIASGRFQVNAERVAEGLLDTVKDLISTRKA